MASSSITSWQIDREAMETVKSFIFLGSKITAVSDCSQEFKRCLLLGRKAITNLDSILKSRDITVLTKVHLVKAMDFPAVMYRCKSWAIKNTEHWRTDAFEICWRRLVSITWTARRSNQSILREINPQRDLERLAEPEGPILWPFDGKSWLIGKDLDAGKDWKQKEIGVAEDERIR